jgi:hypothetical protein
MVTQNSTTLLDLRILILVLGEAHHAGWWRSQFLSPVGLSYLGRLYPRSSFAAAVRSATRAARAVHDTSIGIGNVYHLFRLPSSLEWQMDEALREGEAESWARFVPLLGQAEKLLDELRRLGELGATAKPATGPLRLGAMRNVGQPGWTAQLALVYYTAFRHGLKVFPYFEDGTKHQ